MSKRNASREIEDIAAAWMARCDRGALSPREDEDLRQWLAADPRHLGAWTRAAAIMSHFDRARALGRNYEPAGFAGNAEQLQNPLRRRFFWLGGGIAAAAAAGVVGFSLLPKSGKRFSTRTGEILRVALQDGSNITLNSASTVLVEFSRAQRRVRLLGGEALFDVAHDALRPFIVRAGAASVVAVGTSFTVHLAADAAVEVMVRQGSVDFESDPDLTAKPLRLRANTLALARPHRQIKVEPLQPMKVQRRLAWRDGMISFDGNTLADAAREFARYSDMRIAIDQPDVAKRSVVGLYSASDPVGFARAVARSMNLHVDVRGHRIRIYSSNEKR